MRRKEDPAGYAFDVLVELAQQGSELAREIIKGHPDHGNGKFSCVQCWATFPVTPGVYGGYTLPLCPDCRPAFLASLDEPVAEPAAYWVVVQTDFGPDPVVVDFVEPIEHVIEPVADVVLEPDTAQSVMAKGTQEPDVGAPKHGRGMRGRPSKAGAEPVIEPVVDVVVEPVVELVPEPVQVPSAPANITQALDAGTPQPSRAKRGRPRKAQAEPVDVPAPKMPEHPLLVKPGAIGSPEWKAKISRFMPKGTWD